MLLDGEVYKWGPRGAGPVRLITVEFDKKWVRLTFGDVDGNRRVDILHGIT